MNKFQSILIIALSMMMFYACDTKTSEVITVNTPADGFNLAGSDEKAILLADQVMEAMGGRKAWDTSRYFQWTFFGNRKHVWDKQEDKVRIESPSDTTLVIMNIKDKQGRAFKNGEALAGDAAQALLEKGYRWWVNDSYWLVMPFKLKDSGVTLKYIGQDTTQTGEMSEVISMSFEGVGVTPENKYHVYISNDDRLVKQWDFYGKATDEKPRFQSAWPEYKKYGDLLLSGGQIAGRKLSDIEVSQSTDESIWSF